MVDDSTSQRFSQSNVTIQLQPEPRVNRRLQQERSLKSQQDRQCYLSAVPSQEATGGLNKRSHSGDSREMAVRGKGNYGLTGESWHKASSLYTTTCGYVEQTQSKTGTMTMHHMIGSSVVCDGEQGNMWQWTDKMRSRATRIETDTNVKQRSTEMKHKPDMRQEPIRNRK